MLREFLLTHAVTVLTAIASILMVLRLLATRRSPQSSLAWVVALTFVPWVAIPLYFLIGARKFPRTIKRRTESLAPRAGPPEGPVARVLRDLGAPPVRDAHRFELLENGESAYARLLTLITAARRRIDLTIFILGDDATGWSVVDALAARAKAGVQVRVILDAIGSSKIKRRATRAIRAAGGEALSFMPLLHAPLRGRNNLRCHRKIAVFDGLHVFLGGMNIAEEYMGPAEREGRWRDLAGVASGPIAADAEALFESDWAFCGGKAFGGSPATRAPSGAGDAKLQFVPSGPDMVEDTFYSAVLTALFVAAARVVIVTPYYVPDDVVQRALLLAARRGVKTQLVVPSRSNHAVADFARRGLLRELSEAGVEVHFYPRGMLHAKAMIVDDQFAYIGSPNMDMRSLFLNYEDALCLYGSPEIGAVRRWADGLIAECTTEPPDSGRQHWLLEQIARLLTPEL